MKRALLTIGLCFVTLTAGCLLGVIFEPYSHLFMFWAGVAYLGGLRLIYSKAPTVKNKRWTDVLPANSYVLFTPDDGMFISPDPEDIERAIIISKG